MLFSKITHGLGFVCLAWLSFLPANVMGQSVLAEAYLESANAAREASNIGKAARLYSLALTESHGQQHPILTSRALLGAAAVHIELGELNQAEENVRAALALCDSLPTSPRELLIAGLNGMAMIAFHRHDYEQSEACYLKLLNSLDSAEANQILRAIVLNDLALVNIALNNPHQGWKLATQAADIMYEKFGPASPHYAQCLDTLAQTYHAGDQVDVAERLSHAALQIFEDGIGADTPQFGSALLTLGKIQHHQGRHLESVQTTEHAVSLQERHRGAAHPLVIRARHTHATVLHSLPTTTAITSPSDDENLMFDEMYTHAGLNPNELAALREHWNRIPGSERLKQYVDFHAQIAVPDRQGAGVPKAAGGEAAPAETETTADEEALFHSLFGRHKLSKEELKSQREQWDGLTSEQRRAAAKLFHNSVRSRMSPK